MRREEGSAKAQGLEIVHWNFEHTVGRANLRFAYHVHGSLADELPMREVHGPQILVEMDFAPVARYRRAWMLCEDVVGLKSESLFLRTCFAKVLVQFFQVDAFALSAAFAGTSDMFEKRGRAQTIIKPGVFVGEAR